MKVPVDLCGLLTSLVRAGGQQVVVNLIIDKSK
jgi:hypothetical protein